MTRYLMNLRQGRSVFLCYFIDSSEVRAHSVALIRHNNENNWYTVQAIWRSDKVSCHHVLNLLLYHCDFSICKSVGTEFDAQRITCFNFVTEHRPFLNAFVWSVPERKSSLLLLLGIRKDSFSIPSSILRQKRFTDMNLFVCFDCSQMSIWHSYVLP